MAERHSCKSKFVVYSSSRETLSDNAVSSEINIKDLDKSNILMHPTMYKPIKRLKLQPEFKRKGRKFIVDFLNSQPNPDVGKDIVVDVSFDTEDIELTYDEISNKHVNPRRLVYSLPKDKYRLDKEDISPKIRMYSQRSLGSEHPFELKNLIGY